MSEGVMANFTSSSPLTALMNLYIFPSFGKSWKLYHGFFFSAIGANGNTNITFAVTSHSPL